MSREGRPIKFRAETKDQSASPTPSPPSPSSPASTSIDPSFYSNVQPPFQVESPNATATSCPLLLLPNELLFFLLDQLDPYDLSIVTLVSKRIRDRLSEYVIGCRFGYRRFFAPGSFDPGENLMYDSPFVIPDLPNRFALIGVFLKRLTILFKTSHRVKSFMHFVAKLGLQIQLRNCTKDNYDQFKFRFKCFGIMVQTFVRGWETEESLLLVQSIEQHYSLRYWVGRWLQTSNGSQRVVEYYIRYFYRMVFFDSQKYVCEKAYWINYVLDQYVLTTHHLLKQIDRSSLLILFFGPLIGHAGEVSVVGWENIHTSLFIDDELSALGNAIEIISKLPGYENSTPFLIHALINSPTYWREENQAALLCHVGIEVAQQYFKYVLHKDDVNEVSRLLVFYSVISSRKSNGGYIEVMDFLKKDDPNHFGNFKYLLRELPETFLRIALTKASLGIDDDESSSFSEDEIDVFDFVKTLTLILDVLNNRSYRSNSIC